MRSSNSKLSIHLLSTIWWRLIVIASLLLMQGLFIAVQIVGAQPDPAPSFVTVPAEINKSFTPIAIVSGATSKLKVTVYNLNANELTSATWSDDMPTGITFSDPLTVVNTCGGTVTAIDDSPLAVGGGDFKLTGGTIPPQTGGIPGSCYVEVDVTSYTPGNLINTIPAGDPDPLVADPYSLEAYTIDPEAPSGPAVRIYNTTPASATLNVIGVESPSLSKAFSPTTLFVGETSTLTITVHNNDIDSPLTHATLTDVLPTSGNGDVVLTDPVNPSLSGCGAGALTDSGGGALDPGDTSVMLNDATIQPDSDCVISVDVTSLVQGSYTNTIPAGPSAPGSIQTQEGVTNESPAVANINFQAFTLTKAFGTSPIPVGATSEVTITIQNHAPFDYTGAALDDQLPPGLEFVAGTALTTCEATPPASPPASVSIISDSISNDTVRLTGGTLPANATCTITATARALMSATPGTKINTIIPGALTTAEGATNHASASANLVIQSLAVSKDFTESQIPLGGTGTLTITISNPSPNDFTNTRLDDVLPDSPQSGLYYTGTPTTTCTSGSVGIATTNYTDDTLRLTGATIPGGSIAAPGTCTITATVIADPSVPPANYDNIIPAGTIVTDEGGTNALPTSDTIGVTGIEISKGFSPTTFAAGQTSTLTITITNPATIPFTGANLSDTLPTTTSTPAAPNDELFFTGTPTTTCTSGSETVSLSGVPARTVTLTNGTIPAGGSCTITASVTTAPDAPEANNYRNVIPANALVTTLGASNATPAEAVVNVTTISVDKNFATGTLSYPDTSLLTITISNNANGGALTGVTVTDSLPTGLEVAPYVGGSPAGADPAPTTTCGVGTLEDGGGGALDPGDTEIQLVGGSLPAAPSNCTISVYIRPLQTTSSGTYTNTLGAGSVGTTEGPENSNTVSRNITVEAVSVSKAFQYSGFEAGGTNELTITLTNPTSEDYTNVAVTDTLPTSPNDNLRFTGTPTTTCTSGSELVSLSGSPTRTVSLTGGTIPANSTCTITATVTTDVTALGASYTNRILVGALTTEVGTPPVTGPSNTTQATAPVYVYPDEQGVTGTKTFTPSTINIFGSSRLRITFRAPPDTELTNFSFTDTLPAGLVLDDPVNASVNGCGGATPTDAGDGTLDPGDTSIKLSGATIAANASCTVDVYVTSNNGTGVGTVYTNTITPADVTNDEIRKPPNDVSATLTVRTPSSLIMRKAFYPTIVSPEGFSRLTITLENEGTTELVDVTLDDILPGTGTDGLVIAPTPNASTTCGTGIVTIATTNRTDDTIRLTGGSIPAQVGGVNGLCTINVNVQGKSSNGGTPLTVTNTIPVTNVVARILDIPATMNAQDPASDDLTIRDLDLEVVKGFDPQLVYGGANSEMSIILRNPNIGAELTDITFTDYMPVDSPGPGAMILVTPPGFDATDCGPDAKLERIDDSTFKFSGGYLAPGDECTLTLNTTMTVNGNRTNTIPAAAVTSFNGAYNHTPTSATLTNLAGASVSKSFAPNPVAAGLGSHSILTIEIRTTATVNITGLGLVDDLPAGLQVADWSGVVPDPTNTCGGTLSAPAEATTIELSGGSLLTGFSNCFLTIPVNGAEPGEYTNIIPQGGLDDDQDIRNIQPGEDTLTLTPYSLGNRVWFDTDNNGNLDAGEAGVENVRVELYRDDGSTLGVFDGGDTYLKFETTDADGYYRFDDLGGNDYIVIIPADNFRDIGAGDTVASDPLAGYLSSGTSMDGAGIVTDSIGPDPDNDADNEDNGVTIFAANIVDYVTAQAVTLGPDNVEPTAEADPTTNPETGEATDDQSNRTVDFGFYRQQLGNQVFHDVVTADGTYTSGTDAVVEGATVQLFSSDGTNELAEINIGPDGIWGTDDDAAGGMLTDVNGTYRFSGLPAGSYIVKVFPPGYRSTIDTDNPADTADPDINDDNNDNGVGTSEGLLVSNAVTLTPGNSGASTNNVITNSTGTTYNPTVDFGLIPIVSIGSIVWDDLDRDGLQDAGEPGIPGAVVTLLDGSGTPVSGISSQTTGADGLYYFDVLPEGDYRIQVELSQDYSPTINQNTSDNDDSENDSNIASSVGNIYTSGTFTLTNNSEPDGVDSNIANSDDADNVDDNNGNMTVDFGFYKLMSIGNRVFRDDGGTTGTLDNGVMDGNEAPFAGVRVELYQDTDGTAGLQVATDTLLNFDVTDSNGYYLFDKLDPGDYYVHIPASNFTAGGALEGWYNSNNTFSNDVDVNDNGVNNIHPEVNGISSGLLTLALESEPTLETQLSGEADPGAPGNADFDPTGWDGPNSRGRYNESDLNSNLTIDFGFIPPLSLGNRVWNDSGSISGAPGIDLSQHNDGLMNGAEGSQGIANVTLNLYFDADGDNSYNDIVDGVDESVPYRTTTTDSAGFYLFDGLPEGRFYVEVAATNFSSGNALFRYQSSTGSFDTQADDVNDNGIDDAAYLTNGIRSTDFVLDYTLEPTGESDLPANTVANQTAYGADLRGRFGEEDDSSNLTLDFGFILPHSIGNRVWRDSDNSGTINGADDVNPGIAGVTVNLYAGIDADANGIPDDLTVLATTTTDADGYYLFSNLPAGNFIVGIPASNFDNVGDPLYNLRSSTGTPAVGTYTSPVDANPDQADHGIDSTSIPPAPSTEVFSPIIPLANDEQTGETDLPGNTVTYGPALRGLNGERDENSDLTVDFGFFGGLDVPFSIGNHLWKDDGTGTGTINDGIRQDDEPAVVGARVELYRDGNGDGNLDATELIRFDITDAEGFYLFDNLDPGEYYVLVDAGNFTDSFDPDGGGALPAAPGVLRGWYSSQITALSETGVDNDDNGIDVNYPETSGVVSSVIVLERGVNEPTGETYLSSDSSTTTGFNPTAGDGTGHIGRFGETDATSNMTIDFGFIPPMSLGNRVWIDDGSTATGIDITQYNNGIMDGTEVGVNGVAVNLYKGGTLLRTTTTDSSGYYLFDRLQPGNDYEVRINASNFGAGQPLQYYVSSFDATQATAPADDTEDVDDNGIDDSAPATNGIRSSTIVMAYGTEPTSPPETDFSSDTTTYGANNVGLYGQQDADSNLTMDFGFVRPRSVGNRLWFDTNNDGQLNGGEQPVPDGVRVSLYLDANTDGVPDGAAIRWDTTENGYYLFDNLPAIGVVIGIDASNFQSGGNLLGYFSSTGATNNTDSQDNGIDSTNPAGSTYGILSTSLNLSAATPTGETQFSGDTTDTGFGNNPTAWDGPGSIGRYGESNQNSDLTIDFGFYQVEIGNLVYRDENANGTYDSGTDTPLDNVLVQLFQSNGTTEIITGADGILNTADDGWGPDGVDNGGGNDDGTGGILTGVAFGGSGQYLFSGLPAGDYVVRVITPSGLVSTIDTANSADTVDPDNEVDNNDNGIGIGDSTRINVSSGVLTMTPGETGGTITITAATGTTTDVGVDFGFTYAYALGNRVWFDTDNSSDISGSEVGVDGVTVQLYAADGSGNPTGAVLATDTTSGGGYYLFDYLTADEYVVVIPASNFGAGAVLEGYWSSATATAANGTLSEVAAPDPDDPGADSTPDNADDDIDSDDNGTRQTSGGFNGAVISQAVTLGTTVASEPTGEADLEGGSIIGDQPDGRSNMKLDFGFYKVEIGNLVYDDINKNGNYDSGTDALIDGMTVQLFNSDNTVEIQVGLDGILGTADDATGGVTTASNGWASGTYLFSGLPEGDYVIRAGGLTNYTSTIDSFDQTGTDDNLDPNDNLDNNDNGKGIAIGSVNSGQLTMAAGDAGVKTNNVVDDGTGIQGIDYGTTFNPTVDFGFVEAVAIGNRVWFDTGAGGGIANNGIQDGAETGVENVRVELYSAGTDGAVGGGDDVFIGFDITDASGNYVFDNLIPDRYYLFIPETQFDASGDALYGYMSTTGNGIDETLDQDKDENGIDESDLASNGIYSPVYDLQPNAEPDTTDVETEYTGSLDDNNVNFTADFGFLEYVAIGNRVWLDTGAGTNYNNGIFDSDEVGVNGVTVHLKDTSNNIIATTTTADFSGVPGYYEFDMLAPGDYYVSIPVTEFQTGGVLDGYVSTTTTGSNETSDETADENGIDADVAANGIRTQVYTLQPNTETTSDDETSYSGALGDSDVNFTADLSFVKLVALGNRVWFDNGAGSGGIADDGIQNGTEAGVENVTVHLYRSSDTIGTPYRTTSTDANGDYYFDLLNPGGYFVHIPAAEFQSGGNLAGYVSSTGNGGVNDDDDQNADENGIDENTLAANGIRTPVYTLTPDLEPVPDIDTGYTGYLDDNNVNLTADFGFLQKVAIGNRVWLDNGAGTGTANNGILDGSEAGIDNVTVQLYSAGVDGVAGGGDDTLITSVDTSGGGYYVFDNLLPGSYYLYIPAAEFQSGGDLEAWLSSKGNGTDETTNETGDENGVDNPTPEAASGGGITSTVFNLQPNSEQTSEDQSNYAGALDDDNVNFTADFAFSELVAIGNRVWLDTGAGTNYNNGILDSDEAPLDGVTVQLFGVGVDGTAGTADDTSHGSVDTSGGGYYQFDRLLPGQYYVSIPATEFNGTEELVGYVSTTTTGSNETSDEDADENGIDTDVATNGIRTQVYDLQPNTETTSDDETSYSGALDDDNVNFTADLSFVKLVALGNRVWLDTGAVGGTANDGIQNGSEAGVEFVTVELYRSGDTIGTPYRTTTTDANGDYYFDLLNPGDYFVHIPAVEFQSGGDLVGYISTTGNGGVNNDDDQNADENGIDESDLPTNGISTPFYTLTPDLEPATDIDTGYAGYLDDNNVNLTADFGFLQKVAIGNRIWLDTGAGTNYNNGILDSDELGINGITVNLYDLSNNLIATTTTADYGGVPGYYEFDMLLPGQYYVSIPATEFNGAEELVGYVSTTTTGSNETSDEDADENGIDADVATNGIRTQLYDLQPNSEPTSDDQTNYSGYLDDDNVNFTADLSFVRLVALGNRIWFDTGAGGGIANNGVQDGNELGVDSVTVQLFNVGDDPSTDTPVASTATNGTGDYQFDLLNPGNYFVHIPVSQFQAGGVLNGYLSSTGNGSDEVADQNADENGIDPVTPSTLISAGISSTSYTLANDSETTSDDETSYTGYLDDDNVNFTADFGFLQFVAIGNRVWLDNGAGTGIANNGILDGSEAGIDGVTVELYGVGADGTAGTADDVSKGSVVTSGGGYYFFDKLLPGGYYLAIPSAEFNGSETLAGYLSSTGNGTNETTDETGDENGIDDTEPWNNGVVSTTYDLQPNLEQTGETQTNYTGELDDNNVNFTADFAFQNSPQVDLAVTKTDGEAYYLASGTRTYTITVINNGPIDVTGLTVSDPRPTQLSSWAWTCDSSSPDASPATYGCTADATNPATFTDNLDLPVGASVTYKVAVSIKANATGNLVNTVTVSPPSGYSDLDSDNDKATDTDKESSLTVTKDDGFTVVAPGSELTYTIVIKNTGDTDLADLTVTDTLPAEVDFVSASDNGSYSSTNGTVTWDHTDLMGSAITPLAPTETKTVTVTVRVKDNDQIDGTVGSILNSVHAEDADGAKDDYDDKDTLARENTKSLVSTNHAATTTPQVTIGELLTYRIQIEVPAGVTLDKLKATDVLESGLAFDECLAVDDAAGDLSSNRTDGLSGACPLGGDATNPNPAVTNNGHTVVFSFGDVTNNAAEKRTLSIEYYVVVLDDAVNTNGIDGINNTVTWSWDGGELLGQAEPVKIVEPELSILKTVNPEVALINSTVTYTIDIAHTAVSSADAYDVVVTDIIPAGMEYVDGSLAFATGAHTTTNVIYDATTRTLTVTWDEFPLLATSSFTFDAIFVGPSPVVNEANVAWTSLPIDPSDPSYVQSEYNADSTERWYDPLDSAGINDYRASSSATVRRPSLPKTGFAPGRITTLPSQSQEKQYLQFNNMMLEVPRLGAMLPIVGIPTSNQGWDLTWLSNQVGWLEGTAYPTLAGNTGLTAHTYLADGTPGPFVNLISMRYGDRIYIHANGSRYTYEVRDVNVVSPQYINVLAHEEYDWITLITCREYNEQTGDYNYRVAVRAVLVNVEPE